MYLVTHVFSFVHSNIWANVQTFKRFSKVFFQTLPTLSCINICLEHWLTQEKSDWLGHWKTVLLTHYSEHWLGLQVQFGSGSVYLIRREYFKWLTIKYDVSSKSFCFKFSTKSFIHFLSIFVCGVKYSGPVLFFHMWPSSFSQHHLLKRPSCIAVKLPWHLCQKSKDLFYFCWPVCSFLLLITSWLVWL